MSLSVFVRHVTQLHSLLRIFLLCRMDAQKQLLCCYLGGREIPGSLFLLSASGRKRGSQPTQFACAT